MYIDKDKVLAIKDILQKKISSECDFNQTVHGF